MKSCCSPVGSVLTDKMKYEKSFLWQLPYWQILSRVNKIAMKKFRKNLSFESDFKTQHKWCEQLGRNPD